MSQVALGLNLGETSLSFDTLALHGGQEAKDSATNARAVPIYATTSFVFNTSKHGADLFGLKDFGNIYTRIMNPTTDVFEKRIAALEGGVAGVATSSGQAAQFLALSTICQAGDNIVASSFLYGGTYQQLKVALPRLGITTKFVSSDKPEDFAAAIDSKTKAIYIESVANPALIVYDIAAIAAVAHAAGVPLIVDNTFGAGGWLVSPIKLGADIVVASATKWIGGHGTTIGGLLVDAGTFNWGNGRFPIMTEPSPSYHGLEFWKAFGPGGAVGKNVCFAVRARVEGLRDFGACQNPFGSFLLLQGLETLPLRMERHCNNAAALAKWLSARPDVASVNYLGLPGNPYKAAAEKNLKAGYYGSMLTFVLAKGAPAAVAVVDSFKLVSHLANVGDAKTLAICPGATTHQQLTEAEQISAGVQPGMIRVSVGIEAIVDILADFEQALAAAAAATA